MIQQLLCTELCLMPLLLNPADSASRCQLIFTWPYLPSLIPAKASSLPLMAVIAHAERGACIGRSCKVLHAEPRG